MSALGGKADSLAHPLECLLIARSGHSALLTNIAVRHAKREPELESSSTTDCATVFGQLERLSGKSRLIGSVRLEAMIAIARYGRTTRPRPQRAIAMTVLFVVTIPTA